MAQVQETTLPGVGVRHEFTTHSGERLGTITHRSGKRDLLIFSKADPDACARTIRLDDEDADTLAAMLGAARVAQQQHKVQGEIGGLTLDWLAISASWRCTGLSIADTGIFNKTGVVIVAVMRHGEPIPTPDGNFRLRGGDMAIVVGAPHGIEQAQQLLESGRCEG